jgi:hypothetical protein
MTNRDPPAAGRTYRVAVTNVPGGERVVLSVSGVHDADEARARARALAVARWKRHGVYGRTSMARVVFTSHVVG